jgi:arsenite/tail-anchored protein-transporting ATPase
MKRKLYFVGGKGGVGKSTTAAALAFTCSEQGLKTLLVSTDPAHNAADLFHINEMTHTYVQVSKHLSIIELDADIETDQYIREVKKNMKGLVKGTMIEEVYRQLDLVKSSPGAQEAAVFDRMASLIVDESSFDVIVFDTAPTGHTLRLLMLPELMGAWIDGLLQRRKNMKEQYSQFLYDGDVPDDPIYDVLMKRRHKFTKVRDILTDQEQTEFVFVLNPERLPIEETKRAIEQLRDFQMDVRHLVINKVLPNEGLDSFWEQRKQVEQEYLQIIKETFDKVQMTFIPLFPHDIRSLEDIRNFSAHMNLSHLHIV